jgi:hypothetical protein
MHFPKEALMPRKSPIIISVLLLVLAAAAAPAPLAAAQRNVIVFFELREDVSGVKNAVETIFDKMLAPGDQLIIQSPARVYGFSAQTLARPKAELTAAINDKLRADITRAANSYKQVIVELEAAARRVASMAYPDLESNGSLPEVRDLGELLNYYRQPLANLAQLRKVNEPVLRQLAGACRGQQGENHIIVLFEREFRPIPRREALNVLAEMRKYAFQASELFTITNTKEPFDAGALAEFLKGVPLTLHFVYVTGKGTSATGNMLENSGDVYSAFSKVARATGGVCTATAEPRDGLEAVLKAWMSSK